MMWYDGGWGGWIFMALVMVLFWALIIAGVVALVRYVSSSHRGQPGAPPSSHEAGSGSRRAEDLLAERFARGEIDEDEYKRRITLLREHR
ncbi:SHOCT domain-containing protein [Streptomyces sioyaensis]|uniref:SHOCT domain-containing protein n=1 Tax=Streptomyces sioyaensis TaxID=67364 RepID=UPI0037D778FA